MLKNNLNSDSEERKRKDNMKCIKILVSVKKKYITVQLKNSIFRLRKKRKNERYQIVKDSKLLFGH